MNSQATLRETDYQILVSLRDNSQKDIVDVATELGTSVSTVRRRLGRMEKHGLVSYTIHYDLTPPGDIFAKMSLFVKNLRTGMLA